MAIQLGALRDALLDAGASPEMAGKAAEELAGYEDEFGKVHSALALLRSDTAAEFAAQRATTAAEFATQKADTAAEFATQKTDTAAEFAMQKANMDAGFAAVRSEASIFKAEVKAEFEKVWGELNLHRWMLASIFALLVAVALKIFLR
jgi:hypothetical protein